MLRTEIAPRALIVLLCCFDAAGQAARLKQEPQATVAAPSGAPDRPLIACRALRDGIANVTIPGPCLATALARGETLEIVSCRVSGDVNLRGAKHAGRLFAQDSEFGGAIDLTNATMEGLSVQSGRIESFQAEGATIGNLHFSAVEFGEASFEKAKLGSSYFSRCDFEAEEGPVNDSVSFYGARVDGWINFDEVIFHGSFQGNAMHVTGYTYFGNCTFNGGATFAGIVPEDSFEIEGGITRDSISVSGVTFREHASFSRIMGDRDRSRAGVPSLWLSRIEFRSSASFDRTKLTRMVIGAPGRNRVTFQQTATFRNVEAEWFEAPSAAFRGPADFSGAQFGQAVVLQDAEFLDIVSFDGASVKGLKLGGVRFLRGLDADWASFGPAVQSTSPATWRTLSEAFRARGNLAGETGAYFRQRAFGPRRVRDRISAAFWGYGVRPLRAASWLAALIAVAAIAYRVMLRRSTRPALAVAPADVPDAGPLLEELLGHGGTASVAVWRSLSGGTRLQIATAHRGTAEESSRAAALALNEYLLADDQDGAGDRRAHVDELLQLARGSRVSRWTRAVRLAFRASFSLSGAVAREAPDRSWQRFIWAHSISFKVLFLFFLQALANVSPSLKDIVSRVIPH